MANVGVDRDLRMLNTAVVVLSALTLPQATTSLTADPPAAVLLRDLKCAVPGESAPNLTLHVTANVGQEPRLSLASRSPVGRIWIFDDPHWTPHAAPRFENLYRSLAPLGLEVIVASVRPSSDVWEIAERTGSQLTYARSTKLAATDKQQVEWPYEMYPGGTEFPLKERLDGWVLGVDPQGKVAFAQQMSGNNYELIYDHVRSLLGIPNDPHVLLEQYLRELDSGGSQSIPALLWQLSSFSHAQFDSAKVKQVVAQFEPASIGKATDFVAELTKPSWALKQLAKYPVSEEELGHYLRHKQLCAATMSLALRGAVENIALTDLPNYRDLKQHAEFYADSFSALADNVLLAGLRFKYSREQFKDEQQLFRTLQNSSERMEVVGTGKIGKPIRQADGSWRIPKPAVQLAEFTTRGVCLRRTDWSRQAHYHWAMKRTLSELARGHIRSTPFEHVQAQCAKRLDELQRRYLKD